MFLDVIFIMLALLLIFCTAAVLYLGVFRAGRSGVGLGRKSLAGALSGMLSAVLWSALYSHHYLGW